MPQPLERVMHQGPRGDRQQRARDDAVQDAFSTGVRPRQDHPVQTVPHTTRLATAKRRTASR